VADRWHPEEEYRRHDPTGAAYGKQNRYTQLRVELKADGQLLDLQMEQASGVGFPDNEAMKAFKEAAPFENPPPQLADADGVIRFRWGFLFDPKGPPMMRWSLDTARTRQARPTRAPTATTRSAAAPAGDSRARSHLPGRRGAAGSESRPGKP
jgi:TonB family protein